MDFNKQREDFLLATAKARESLAFLKDQEESRELIANHNGPTSVTPDPTAQPWPELKEEALHGLAGDR